MAVNLKKVNLLKALVNTGLSIPHATSLLRLVKSSVCTKLSGGVQPKLKIQDLCGSQRHLWMPIVNPQKRCVLKYYEKKCVVNRYWLNVKKMVHHVWCGSPRTFMEPIVNTQELNMKKYDEKKSIVKKYQLNGKKMVHHVWCG